MKNKLDQLKNDLSNAIENPSTDIEKIEKISYDIDKVIEKTYLHSLRIEKS